MCIDLKALDNLLSGEKNHISFLGVYHSVKYLSHFFLLFSPFSKIALCNWELGNVIMYAKDPVHFYFNALWTSMALDSEQMKYILLFIPKFCYCGFDLNFCNS